MGFEIIYSYHEKIDGSYDMESTHELKRKVGKPYDDTPYERLAAAIMGQYARRDIMVIDVEIVEFVKKKISFRETKNGICIKNKKFLFDGTEIEMQETPDVPAPVAAAGVLPHNNIAPPPAAAPSTPVPAQMPKNSKPIRFEVFQPDQGMAQDARARGLKFTVGNRYPIYEEKQDRRGIMYGMLYVTIDNAGQKQIMSDRLFVFKQALTGGSQFDDSNKVELDYGPGLQQNSGSPIYGN